LCSAFISTKLWFDRGNAYEDSPDMFYKRTTEAKQRIFGVARSFLAEPHIIGLETDISTISTHLLDVW
jgi:hypothetical protein